MRLEEGRQGRQQAQAQVIYAVDCDLQQSYVVGSDGSSARGESPLAALRYARAKDGDLVIYEIAEPASFVRGAQATGPTYRLARWALWNVAHAVQLHMFFTLLVAPASVWTRGYNKEQRHAIAKATAAKKDLRDCQAMLYFYHRNPALWVPISEYLTRLRSR